MNESQKLESHALVEASKSDRKLLKERLVSSLNGNSLFAGKLKEVVCEIENLSIQGTIFHNGDKMPDFNSIRLNEDTHTIEFVKIAGDTETTLTTLNINNIREIKAELDDANIFKVIILFHDDNNDKPIFIAFGIDDEFEDDDDINDTLAASIMNFISGNRDSLVALGLLDK